MPQPSAKQLAASIGIIEAIVNIIRFELKAAAWVQAHTLRRKGKPEQGPQSSRCDIPGKEGVAGMSAQAQGGSPFTWRSHSK